MEIVKLIGSDVLPDDQKLILEIARVIRLGSYSRTHSTQMTPVSRWKNSIRMMEIILYLYKKAKAW